MSYEKLHMDLSKCRTDDIEHFGQKTRDSSDDITMKYNDESATYVYGAGRMKAVDFSNAIVNTVLTICDEGPPAMINLRPVPKHPNATDSFERENQQNFDNKDDRVARVDQHNSGYPKLRDELDKKRSLTNVRAVKKRQNYRRASRNTRQSRMNCKVCKRRKKGNRKPSEKYKKRESRVSKNRIFKNAATSSMFKCLASRGCQYLSEIYHRATSPHISMVAITDKNLPPKEVQVLNDLKSDFSNNCPKIKADSVKSLNKSGTSVASLSSFNSFLSLDHEPMVNDKPEEK